MASSINASTSGAGGLITTADNTGILNLQTASTNAVTIDASQQVGIGVSTPQCLLDVSAGSSGAPTYTGLVRMGGHASQSLASKGGLEFVSSSYASGYGWRITGIDLGGGSNPFVFQNRANSTSWTERMRIDESGKLLLAGTSAIAGYQFTMYHTDTGGMAYKYNGTSEQNSCSFQNGNGQVGRIYTSNSNTTYSTSSDYRLKENVVPMTGALDKVAQLNPVTFTWKTDGTDGQGFIAHELQAVVPDCVGGTKDAVDADGNPVYQDIDTSFLVATLTAAIQEQQTIINDLKARIETLEAK